MPTDPFLSSALSSPWLITFDDSVTDRIRSPPLTPLRNDVYHGYSRSTDVFSPRNEVLQNLPEIVTTPTTASIFPTTLPQGTLEGTVTQRRFFAIAARAYQEAVKFPEEPPQLGWTPDDDLHSYYQAILSRFGIYFREILGQQNRFHDSAFRVEWEVHARNIMANIRAEWGMHPMGSTASIRTTARTENSPAAVIALQFVIRKPMSPPAAGWAVGDPLHPYYEMMLDRFQGHLRLLLREFGMSLFQHPIEIPEAIDSFTELMMREYRDMWILTFGL